MKLQVFETIKEKKKAFDYEQITSFDAVVKKVDEINERQKSRPIYFRGQANASWKIYSSAQREWITRELDKQYNDYAAFIRRLLDFSKTNYALFLKNECKIVTDISIFSVLQHYGAPTPFVDWTSDYNVALYFASQTAEQCLGNELNSFVSIYWLEVGDGPATPNNDLYPLSKVLEDYRQKINVSMQNLGVSSSQIEQFYKNATQFSVWGNLPILWIEESDEDYMKISNHRYDLQNGAFIFNKDSNKSLDEIFDGHELTNIPTQYDGLLLPKIHCIDIHKSVLPKIKKYLNEIHYDAMGLGLNNQNWGEKFFQESLEV